MQSTTGQHIINRHRWRRYETRVDAEISYVLRFMRGIRTVPCQVLSISTTGALIRVVDLEHISIAGHVQGPRR